MSNWRRLTGGLCARAGRVARAAVFSVARGEGWSVDGAAPLTPTSLRKRRQAAATPASDAVRRTSPLWGERGAPYSARSRATNRSSQWMV
jgi:hypothetical protein